MVGTNICELVLLRLIIGSRARPPQLLPGYASSSEVVREALRDWKTKRALQLQELAALKADIDRGLTDLAEGRVQDFDAARIIERGSKLLAGRSRSAYSRISGPK